MKRIAKRWIRPLVVPVFRLYIRYCPLRAGKLFLWRLISPYLIHADRRFTARTVFGSRISGNSSDYVPMHLYYFGIWEPSLTWLIRRSLKPGDVFVDVGANVGYYTVLASRLVGPSGRVIALEPSPRLLPLLRGNVALSRCGNTTILGIAASDRTEQVALFLAGQTNLGETTMIGNDGQQREALVPARPLSEVLSPEDLRRARFIKIDVEGAEGLVVSGLVPVLPQLRHDVMVALEFNPGRIEKLGMDPSVVLWSFEQHGFRPYALHNTYDPSTYLPRPVVRPVAPLEHVPVSQCDLVFSRCPL